RRNRGLDPRSRGDQPDLLGHRGDLARPDVLRGVVDLSGLTVEVRAGDVVPAVVAVGVVQQAGHTVDVAETLGVAVLEEPRATVVAAGDGALQRRVLLDLVLRGLGLGGAGLAVAPLRRLARVGLAAVGVLGEGVAEGADVLAGRLVPREALATDDVAEATDVLDLVDDLVEVSPQVLAGGAGLEPLLHVVARDGPVAATVLRHLARATVTLGLALGDVGNLRLAILLAGAPALARPVVLLLGDFLLADLGARVVRTNLLVPRATVDVVAVGVLRVETALGVLVLRDLDGLDELLALVGLVLGPAVQRDGLVRGAADAVVNGNEGVVAVEVLVDVEVVVREGLLADVDAVRRLALVVARDEDPLVHDVAVAGNVVDAVTSGGDQVLVVSLDGGAGAPGQLALLGHEENLADGLRQVDVVSLGLGLLLLADRQDGARLAVRRITALRHHLRDALAVPVVGHGLLQSGVVGLGPEVDDFRRLRLAGGQGVVGDLLVGGLSSTGQAGRQETSGQNGATGRKEDALQGNSLRCRGTPLASHASVKG